MKICIKNQSGVVPEKTQGKTSRIYRRIPGFRYLALWMTVFQFFGTVSTFGQSDERVAPDDRAPLQVRYPAPNQLRELQTDRDYQYSTNAPPPANPVARFFDWLLRKLATFLRSKAYQNGWQYVILAAIAGLVVYLLTKVEALSFLFSKRARTDGLGYENLAENIHEINFGTAVEEAVNQRNYRLAVRLLYLQTLKRLTDAGRIDYKPDKTNRQYIYELATSPLQSDFEQLTRQFEFVWYGDFPINETQFTLIREQFQLVNQSFNPNAITRMDTHR